MMGRQAVDQGQLFYLFNLEEHIPTDHLLRRINPIVTGLLADLREKLAPFYSDIGRPSIDPELMIRMLIVGYCYGIRFERRLCEEVKLHLGYRWFCRLELEDKVPDHSTFSVKVCAMLVPREMKLEHTGGVKAMTDEQIEASIAMIKEMIAKRDAGENAKVIEGEAEVVPSLPAPGKRSAPSMPKA